MVPLFMAGDKFFFDIARQLKQELKIPLVIFCAGNELERTDFKGGFAGIKENYHGQRLFAFSLVNKLKLSLFYLSQYLKILTILMNLFLKQCILFVQLFYLKMILFIYHYLKWDECYK